MYLSWEDLSQLFANHRGAWINDELYCISPMGVQAHYLSYEDWNTSAALGGSLVGVVAIFPQWRFLCNSRSSSQNGPLSASLVAHNKYLHGN